jgi:hypothetical protein
MLRVTVPTGPEMFVNGDFSDDMNGWRTLPYQCTGSATLDALQFHSAPQSVRIEVTSIAAADGSFKLYQSPLSLGQDVGYTLRFWGRAEPAQEVMLHLYGNDCPLLRCLNDKRVVLTSEWQEFVIPFQATTTTNTAALNVFATTVGQVWVDDVSLREGNSSVYRRNFENGIALLNYTADPITIDLGDNFQRLDVAASSVFDGALVQQETVPPWDARILLTVAGGEGPPSDPVPPPVSGSRLEQNVPNPFNPGTEIRFELSRQEKVTLAVFDIAGRRVRTLVNRVLSDGIEHNVIWNGRDQFDRDVPSGIYLYRLETPSFTKMRKMTLLR